MFCLYCGTNLPEDAVFCNKCGKQQNAAANEPATDITTLPFPTLSEASIGSGGLSAGNVPMVQGTPSTLDSPPGQGSVHGAANAAPSASPQSIPPQAPSSTSLASTQQTEPQTHHQIASHSHPPHATPTMSSPTESPASPVHYPHVGDRSVSSDGLKLAGNISRRAVVAGLAGITGLAIVGGGLAWVTLSRRPQTSSTTSAPTATPTPIPLGTTLLTYTGHSTTVNTVTWSPDGRYIASGAFDRTVQVWDAASGNKVLTYRGHASSLFKVRWSPDGKRIASGGGFNAEPDHGDTTVQVWDALTGKNALIYRGHSGWVDEIAWSSDSKRIASYGVGESTVQVWDALTGSTLLAYSGQAAEIVVSVEWSPDGRYIATSGYGGTGEFGTVQIWNAATGNTILTIQDDWGSLAWSPDSKQIAIGSSDLQVRDVATGDHIFTNRGHSASPLAWSPDGQYIAAVRSISSDNAETVVWNIATKKIVLTYRGHASEVFDIGWSPDSKRIATANRDGTVLVWQAA